MGNDSQPKIQNDTPRVVEVYRDIEIVLTANNKFRARIESSWVERGSISQIKSAINGIRKPMTAYSANHFNVTSHQVVDYTDQPLGPHNARYYGTLYFLTDEEIKQLEEIIREFDRFQSATEKKWDGILKKAEKLTAKPFAEKKKAQAEK